MVDPLHELAAAVRDDPFFLAPLLADFARSGGLDDAALAARLGCPIELLAKVSLCRAPRPDAAGCREDVVRIAEHFGLDAAALAAAVKRGRVLGRLRASAGGLMMAARDRDDEEADS